MKIALIEISSAVHDQSYIDKSLEGFVEELEDHFDLSFFDIENISKIEENDYDIILNFVKTGGTENLFKDKFSKLPRPFYFLATSLHNSLPASIEMLSYVQSKGEIGKILHGDMAKLLREIKKYGKINSTKNKIAKSKLGVIGEPSDWLIASKVNYSEIKTNWGLNIIDIELDEVYDRFDNQDEEEVEDIVNEFLANANEIVENTKDDTRDAVRVYLALKEIADKYELDALTIRCFDLVQNLNTTGCLALSYLNDEGIIAGCEGDVPATFTMMVINYLLNEESFMANPYKIDSGNNRIEFAHCTVPTALCTKYNSRSHFETGIGVGIQGTIPEGPATVMKIGGKNLNKYYLEEGSIDLNLDNPHACRTQIEVSFKDEINIEKYFFEKPLGNHQIIVPGRYTEILADFFRISSVKQNIKT
ncbi:MAG: L-arabinose isomerase family protein [Bacillota bacterium]